MLAGAALLGGLFGFSRTAVLAENGKAKAEIVLGANPVTAAQFAALELQAHLQAMTGAEFPIVDEGARTKGAYPIFVGATKESVGKYDPAKFSEQGYVIDVDGDRTILFGRDNEATQKVSVVYAGGPGAIASASRIPTKWTSRGSLNAVYDFLHDRCGVRWLDCTEAGTIVPSRPTLAVKTGTAKGAPFTRTRDASVEPEEWMKKRSPKEYEAYRRTVYPLAYAASRDQRVVDTRINALREIFGLRLKLGGYKQHANHSFYWCYDRFWDKTNPNFIAFHPDWFSRHLKRDKQGRAVGEGVFSEVDTARRPGQMCFSSEGFFRQTVEDIRAYFDVGGYTNRYTNQGSPCSVKSPAPSWGKDVYCLEPMDNGAFCECAECMKQYRPDLPKELSAAKSDYWFGFVNKVAREIKKSHPDKLISTLAYGGGREGLPSFKIEDNVVVHFCWDANRGPNREPLMTRQMNLMRAWRKAYPKNPFGVWLYNGFPHESGTWYHYLPIPGFFGKLFDDQMKFLRDLDMRECVFHCGLRDDFELFLGGRLMWNPDEKYETIKDEFFSSYGPAAPAVRKFYDLVESRYCNTNNYVDAKGKYHNGHMGREMSWSLLIRDQELKELAAFMAEGEAAIAGGTAQEKARFANWKAGYWDYIRQAKFPKTDYPSPRAGVKLSRTEFYASKELPFDDKDVLEGKPFSARCGGAKVPRHFFWGLRKESTPESFTDMTTDPGFIGFWNAGAPSQQLVYRCNVRIERLKRLRIVTNDPARSRLFFNLVGWRGDEKVTILEGVYVKDSFYGIGCAAWDFEFEPGVVPPGLDAIGIEERYPEKKGEITNSPRYIRIRAADWGPEKDRFTWFDEARFGMFIHWGIYAVPADGEWYMNRKKMPASEYNKFADSFKQPASFSPEEWVKLAVKAGMRYAVLTTRHHDGFCLFDTKTTDFNAFKYTGRDYVREFADACRRHGIRVGFYYSIMNWQFDHSPKGVFNQKVWDAQVECTHAALKELMANYGKVDLLWYDGCGAPGACDGEAMNRMWRTKELNAMVRRLQPGIIINDRSCMPEDYSTPEQCVTPPAPGRRWESCMTLNGSWGYRATDANWKSPDTVWRLLLHCCRFGGNYLLNIGPRADGSVPEESVRILTEVGERVRACSDGIYGSVRTPYTEATHAAGVVTKTPHGYHLFSFNSAKLDGVKSIVPVEKDVYRVEIDPAAEKTPCDMLGGRHDVVVKAGDAPVLGANPSECEPPVGELVVDDALKRSLVGCTRTDRMTGLGPRLYTAEAVRVPLPAEGRFVLEIGYVGEAGCPATLRTEVPSGLKGEYVWKVPASWRVYAVRLTPRWEIVRPESFSIAGSFPTDFCKDFSSMEGVRAAMREPWPEKAKTIAFQPVPERNRLADHSDVRVSFTYSAQKPGLGVGAAKVTVDSDADRTVLACLGVDWWADVYVNGVKVRPLVDKEKPGDPAFVTHSPRQFRLPLKKGANEVLVVCHSGSRSHWFALWTNR